MSRAVIIWEAVEAFGTTDPYDVVWMVFGLGVVSFVAEFAKQSWADS